MLVVVELQCLCFFVVCVGVRAVGVSTQKLPVIACEQGSDRLWRLPDDQALNALDPGVVVSRNLLNT